MLNPKLPEANATYVFVLAVILNVIFSAAYGHYLHGWDFDCTPPLGQVAKPCGIFEYTFTSFLTTNFLMIGFPIMCAGVAAYTLVAIYTAFKKV